MPSRSATTRTSTRPSPKRAFACSGTHTSPLHAPSGLIAQPVAASKAEASTARSVRITTRRLRARPLVPQVGDDGEVVGAEHALDRLVARDPRGERLAAPARLGRGHEDVVDAAVEVEA